MLPVTFETFLEQGASKIDASVRELQRTYDEVVWGIESPPSYIEKKKEPSSTEVRKLGTKTNKKSLEKSKKQHSFGQVLTPRSVKQSRQRHQKNQVLQTTPSTVMDVDSLFGDNDIWSYQESTASLTSSASDSEKGTPNNMLGTKATGASWKYSSSNNSTNNNSLRCESPANSILEQPNKSIDEIFGYNTRQSIRKRKTFADQDVGLDFCLLEAPSGDGGNSSRSLLIVQRIDPKGIFAKTGLGVGDAVLAINGVSFREDEQPVPHGLHKRNKKKSKNKDKNNSSVIFKPNLFKARALLNGRGLIVTIDYQKFGEIHSGSSRSVEQNRLEDESVDDSHGDLKTPVVVPPRASSYPSRRSQSSSTTRVDFLGMLRSSDKSSKKKKEDRQTSLESTNYSNRSHSTRGTMKTGNTKESPHRKYSDEKIRKSDRDLEAPPKISRLTRLKARTKKMRKSLASGNGNKNGKVTVTDDKDKFRDNRLVTPSETASIPNTKHGSDANGADSSFQPYQSLLSNNNGPEEQIQLLKERVRSSSTAGTYDDPPSILEELGDSEGSADIVSPVGVGSPARSTHSESYLQELRKQLSSTANEILNDLSSGKTGQLGVINERNTVTEDPQEMIRMNRNVVQKLQARIDSLKNSNEQLFDDLSSLRRRRDENSEKLAEAERQLEQASAKTQVYESELGLFRSRLEISKIQADKRRREMEAEKEKSVAENDKVIADLSKRIENLEEANRRLLEKLQKVESKRQEKYNSLQAQFERLKMKFSAQSTLLDNVMTSNEELTSQNEALEAELMTGAKQQAASPGATQSAAASATGMLFAEASEYDTEHIKRDPILLAQAQELSTLREANANLEDKIESLSTKLYEIQEKEDEQEGNNKTPPEDASGPTPAAESSSSPIATSKSGRSLLDVTITNSADSADSGNSDHHQRINRNSRPPLPRRRDANPKNVSIENPSDESIGTSGSVENHNDEEAAFGSSVSGGCLPQLPVSKDVRKTRSLGLCGPDTTLNLQYRHKYEDGPSADDHDDDETTTNSAETETTGNRWDHKNLRNCDRSTLVPSTVDESFESVSSLFLMERILELETALQDNEDLDPEQKQHFLTSLQSRISKLHEKGYERIGSVEVVSNDEGSVEVTNI